MHIHLYTCYTVPFSQTGGVVQMKAGRPQPPILGTVGGERAEADGAGRLSCLVYFVCVNVCTIGDGVGGSETVRQYMHA